MPIYRFRVMPPNGAEDASLRFSDENSALGMAKVMLRNLAREAASQSRSFDTTIEVCHEDGSVIGVVELDKPSNATS